MPSSVSIHSPKLLRIQTGLELYSDGASQLWYPTSWQRQAGCGPTACAHLLWYLSQTRPSCAPLCLYDGTRREGFLRLMEDVWSYVTPGSMGVNSTELFTDGAIRYGADRGVALRCRTLEISPIPTKRPQAADLLDFLRRAFLEDLPVAFLNLSNGALRNLESWHWVTLVSVFPEDIVVHMYDQGVIGALDLPLWLRTTMLGGGFVAIEPTIS